MASTRQMKSFFMAVIFFSLLVASLPVFAIGGENLASDFRSNGDLINGWYWLRDPALQHYAGWTFKNIPRGTEDLTLDITALATNRASGGGGFPAEFSLIYGFPGSGLMGGVFKKQAVTLPNTSSPDDPLGYTCRGRVTISRSFFSGASTILLRVERTSPDANHVAFRKESIILVTGGGVSPFLEGSWLPETDKRGKAALIQADTYIGDLGGQREGGQHDNNDWYSVNLQEGQIISLDLTVPQRANFNLYLYRGSASSSAASSCRGKGQPESIQYVAGLSGTWYIRVRRSFGEGNYRLSVNTSAGQTDQPAVTSLQGLVADNFRSNGDLINGWYWLRDFALQHYAEWTFQNVPRGTENLTLDITALATNRASGGGGFPAEFSLIYGFPGSGLMGGVFKTQPVTLPNTSSPDDPLGYTCRGRVTISRYFFSRASTILLRVEQTSPNANYVAFRRESIVIFMPPNQPSPPTPTRKK